MNLPKTLIIIDAALEFQKGQPALRKTIFWLVFLPTALLIPLQDEKILFSESIPFATRHPWAYLLGLLFLYVVSIILILWGRACITVVGKRLIEGKPKQSNTSFKTVRKEAQRSIIPLSITAILRHCIILALYIFMLILGYFIYRTDILGGNIILFFWVIIPPFIYHVRTYFYHIAVICEGKKCRKALRHSKAVVTGQTWKMVKHYFCLGITIYLPITVISIATIMLVDPFGLPVNILSKIVLAYISSFTFLVFTLSMIILYADLKRSSSKKS